MEDNEVKDKILIKAGELFMKYGIRSISMDDIARNLAVSKKTLYQHFADKEEIITKVFEAHMIREKKVYDEITNTSSNAIEELSKISICLRKNMEETHPSLLHDIQKYHPKAYEVWQGFKHEFIMKAVIRNLLQGINEGYFRPEIRTEIIAMLRIITVEAGFDDQLFPKNHFSLLEVQSQIFDHFVYGLCTEKGRRLYQKYKENNI